MKSQIPNTDEEANTSWTLGYIFTNYGLKEEVVARRCFPSSRYLQAKDLFDVYEQWELTLDSLGSDVHLDLTGCPPTIVVLLDDGWVTGTIIRNANYPGRSEYHIRSSSILILPISYLSLVKTINPLTRYGPHRISSVRLSPDSEEYHSSLQFHYWAKEVVEEYKTKGEVWSKVMPIINYVEPVEVGFTFILNGEEHSKKLYKELWNLGFSVFEEDSPFGPYGIDNIKIQQYWKNAIRKHAYSMNNYFKDHEIILIQIDDKTIRFTFKGLKHCTLVADKETLRGCLNH